MAEDKIKLISVTVLKDVKCPKCGKKMREDSDGGCEDFPYYPPPYRFFYCDDCDIEIPMKRFKRGGGAEVDE